MLFSLSTVLLYSHYGKEVLVQMAELFMKACHNLGFVPTFLTILESCASYV